MALIVVALVAGVVVLGTRATESGDGSVLDGDLADRIPPEAFVGTVARQWAAAWAANDTAAMSALAVGATGDLVTRVASFRDGLRITGLRATPRAATVDGARASVTLDVAADLAGLGTWIFTTDLALVLPDDAPSLSDWRVSWSRAALHPALVGERRLAVARALPPRGALLAADGTPLTGEGAAAPPALAAQLLGRVGVVETDGPERLTGDAVGVSGLQAAFDAELGGSATGDVQVVDDGGVVEVLEHFDGRPAAPVRTSIDLRVQRAAESALAPVTQPAAAVALRPSTGEVLAVVSNPVQGFNRALSGRYPPGSTFKVVTSTALLGNGVTADTPTTCPEVATINGREFRNAEGAALGDIDFRRAFYESCNTAFVQLASQLESNALVAAAEAYGFNAPVALEVPVEESSFPAPHSVVDQASASIGQGRVLATPVQMARVAATVASGVLRPPTLRAVSGPVEGRPLDLEIVGTLQQLMRLVVAQGTGTAAQLPGEPVAGKTGTAEFGTETPPRTHAWFIGFRGDLAVAVVVEDGGFGGRVAAPLARQILASLG